MNKDTIFGTFDGTGAAINVCLGFVPRYVKIWNLEDTTDLPELEWHSSMQAVASAAFGVLKKTVAGVVMSDLAAGGISSYAGGDVIVYDADDSRWETLAGADASEVYLDGTYNRDASGDAAYQCYGDFVCPDPRDGARVTTVPGFTLGTDADMNVNGQQLVFMAVR
jgi:hypothetical protein